MCYTSELTQRRNVKTANTSRNWDGKLSGEQSCRVGKRLRNKADTPRPPTWLSTSTLASLRERAHSSAKVGLKPRHKKHPRGLDRTPVPCGPCQAPTCGKDVHRAVSSQPAWSPSRWRSHRYWQPAPLELPLQTCKEKNGNHRRGHLAESLSIPQILSITCVTDFTFLAAHLQRNHVHHEISTHGNHDNHALSRDHQTAGNQYTETDCVVTRRPSLVMTWAHISG